MNSLKRIASGLKNAFRKAFSSEKQTKRPLASTHSTPENKKNTNHANRAVPTEIREDKRRRNKRKDKRHDNRPGDVAARREEPRRSGNGRQPDLKRVVPPMPEIKDIPVEEGKTRFIDLGIAQEVLAGVQELGFKYCTPIQEQCIPHALAGKDVTGWAQTGTGKTAAFLTAIFTMLLNKKPQHHKKGFCRVVILAPTRELAIQIHKDAEGIGKFGDFHNVVVYGGMDRRRQGQLLNRPIDLLIGTPGRIIDFMRSGNLHMGEAEFLVIDEADRMLDMGFIPDVRRIVNRLPKKENRQTYFFSATLTGDIKRLISQWLVDPVMIEIESESLVAELIEEKFYTVTSDEKLEVLKWIYENDNVDRMLVFVNRKDVTEKVTRKLHKMNIACEILSGDVPQEKRLKVLERFRSGKLKVIVATDVAARGIHVDGVSHVVNYEIPYKAEEYVHRVGRTGRAGTKGKAITFVCEYGAYTMPDLEKYLGHELPCEYPEFLANREERKAD